MLVAAATAALGLLCTLHSARAQSHAQSGGERCFVDTARVDPETLVRVLEAQQLEWARTQACTQASVATHFKRGGGQEGSTRTLTPPGSGCPQAMLTLSDRCRPAASAEACAAEPDCGWDCGGAACECQPDERALMDFLFGGTANSTAAGEPWLREQMICQSSSTSSTCTGQHCTWRADEGSEAGCRLSELFWVDTVLTPEATSTGGEEDPMGELMRMGLVCGTAATVEACAPVGAMEVRANPLSRRARSSRPTTPPV